ncbi:MAG TPA: YheC/YheD family protein [Candidatus Ignatzschineria merdigallinarum]|uniref:YheC/YheD family protein n=1 Tax=Candidatus Ignatzschineria merdigallinarum TaxID=2838621 RepID=A0A9D1TUV1_9GAMM|nr:YheC/YheD family protein [Candidatus Ignatzschineria merdigallinarum]
MTAKELGYDAVFFNISNVDYSSRIINGKRLVFGEWLECSTPFPDIIFNDLPAKYEVYKKYLELENISNSRLLIHHRTIDKAACNNLFQNYPEIIPHLIPTFNVKTSKDVLNYVNQYKRIALKPNNGHKGFGIKFLRQQENGELQLQHENGNNELLSIPDVSIFLEKILSDKKYHIQPEIISHLRDSNFPFVIRTYMGRGINGQWFNLFNYAAMDYKTGGVVNVSQGAGLQFYPNFLEREFPHDKGKAFAEKLRSLSHKIVQAYQSGISEEVDAIGLDYIVDESGKPYMVEINYYPGTRPNSDICVYNQVRFAEYLYKKKMALINTQQPQ